jgi:hypothetical protein
MSTDQYRAGFETWAMADGYNCDYVSGPNRITYIQYDTQAAWEAWTASKREASTEPSAALVDCLKCEGRGKHAKFDGTTLFDGACAQCGGSGRVLAGALSDDAKDAAYQASRKMANILYNALQQDALPEDWRSTTRETTAATPSRARRRRPAM